MHQKHSISAGKELTKDSKVLILLHGRGGSAEDILSLAPHLEVADYTLLAPQATNNTWYPYSFMAPPAQNEPWLSSALQWLKELVDELHAEGIAAHLPALLTVARMMENVKRKVSDCMLLLLNTRIEYTRKE